MQQISLPGDRFDILDVTELLALLRTLENRQLRRLIEQLAAGTWPDQTGREAHLLKYLRGNISDSNRAVNGSRLLDKVWDIPAGSLRITRKTPAKERRSIERRLKKGVKQLKATLEALQACTLDFLIQESMREDPLLRTQVLERILRERRVPDLYRKNGEKHLSLLAAEDYNQLTLYASWRMEHQLFFRQVSHGSGELISHFHRANGYLDQAYCLTKLRYLCEYENQRKIVGLTEAFQNAFPPEEQELIERLIAIHAPDHPVFALYQLLLTFIRRSPPDLKLLERLEDQYESEKERLAVLDRLVIVKLVSNHLNRGQAIHQPQLPQLHFHWGKKLLADDIVLNENIITPTEFIHQVYLAGPVGDIDFIERFITRYRDKLPVGRRDIALGLSTAYLRFHQQRFIESAFILEETFPKHKTDLDYFQVPVKVLRLKNYLELCLSGEWDAADETTRNALRDFNGYLNRYFATPTEHFHTRFQVSYHAFLQFCRKLYNYRNYAYLDHKEEIETLITALREAESVLAREWLLAKATSLRR